MCLVTQELPRMSSERIKVYKLVVKKENNYCAPIQHCVFDNFPTLESEDEIKIFEYGGNKSMAPFNIYMRGFIHAYKNIDDIYKHLWYIISFQYCEIWEGYIPKNTQFGEQGDVNKMFLGDKTKNLREMLNNSEIAATKIVLTNKVVDNDEIQKEIAKIRSSH